MKTYYFTYEVNDSYVVWGVGKTENQSEKDAKKSLDNFNTFCSEVPQFREAYSPKLRTKLCSKELFDWIMSNGGNEVIWSIKNGIAKIAKDNGKQKYQI